MAVDSGETWEKKFKQKEMGHTDLVDGLNWFLFMCLCDNTHYRMMSTCTKVRKEPKNERWTCAVRVTVFFLTTVAVAQLIALLACTVWWRDVRHAVMTRWEQTACVNSSRLMNHEAMCPEGMYTRDGSCCGDVSYVVDALLKQYSRTKFQDTVSARMLSKRCQDEAPEVKLVAMVPGLDMPRIQQQGEGTMVFWNEALPTTILQGFRYQDGAIFIGKTGHYYVYSEYFRIAAPSKPTIRLAKSLDYERVKVMTVQIMASDNPGSNMPSLSATATLTVSVTDADDQNPEFSRNAYTASISEDATPGSRVDVRHPIKAVDPDSMNATVEYKLLDPYDIFAINTTTDIRLRDKESRLVVYMYSR